MLKPISRALVLVCLLTCPCLADIKTYIDKPDDSYAYKVVQEQQVMGVNIRVVERNAALAADIAVARATSRRA